MQYHHSRMGVSFCSVLCCHKISKNPHVITNLVVDVEIPRERVASVGVIGVLKRHGIK